MEVRIITVSELTNNIRFVLEDNFDQIRVKGEISNFKFHSSGHRYFTLKDQGAQIQCVLWKGKPLNFQMADGMMVVVEGRITVYPARGNYQIDCSSVIPQGQGDLFIAFEALKKKLGEKGYFETDRKRDIPFFPLKIGIVTSPTGAALRDMISTIQRRMPACTIYLRPALVQGEGASKDIVSAINELWKYPLDVIIIGRGGGSIEDLWSFNEEIVADAIFNSPIPVISAVGHETDFTISDFTADFRAATPTAAAELVTSVTLDSIQTKLFEDKDYIKRILIERINDFLLDIKRLEKSSAFRRVRDNVMDYKQKLDEFETDIKQSSVRNLKSVTNKLKGLDSHFLSVNPYSPLKKGYSLLKGSGKILTKNDSLTDYNNIKIIRLNEAAEAEIKNVTKYGDLI